MSSILTGSERLAVVSLAALAVFLPATLRAQNGAPASLRAVTVTSQQAAISTGVQQPPGVIVRDASGNPVQGVTVSFITATGGGTASRWTKTCCSH